MHARHAAEEADLVSLLGTQLEYWKDEVGASHPGPAAPVQCLGTPAQWHAVQEGEPPDHLSLWRLCHVRRSEDVLVQATNPEVVDVVQVRGADCQHGEAVVLQRRLN